MYTSMNMYIYIYIYAYIYLCLERNRERKQPVCKAFKLQGNVLTPKPYMHRWNVPENKCCACHYTLSIECDYIWSLSLYIYIYIYIAWMKLHEAYMIIYDHT